jgi:hypothetical protein
MEAPVLSKAGSRISVISSWVRSLRLSEDSRITCLETDVSWRRAMQGERRDFQASLRAAQAQTHCQIIGVCRLNENTAFIGAIVRSDFEYTDRIGRGDAIIQRRIGSGSRNFTGRLQFNRNRSSGEAGIGKGIVYGSSDGGFQIGNFGPRAQIRGEIDGCQEIGMKILPSTLIFKLLVV